MYSLWVSALDCTLAFTYWDRAHRSYRPLPDGVEVLVRDADPLSPDDTLGSARIAGGEGKVLLEVVDRDEARPEVFFEIRFVEQGIELDSGALQGLRLPKVWSSRGRYSEAYERGLWKNFSGHSLGSDAEPIAFRITFDAFVRFVRWDEAGGNFVGLPEGTPVKLVEHDVLTQTVLAKSTLDDQGRAVLTVLEDHEHRPDLSLELDLPQALGGPWSSREAFRKGSLVERGFWDDHIGTRIGRWGSPYTFDLSTPQPRRVPGNRVRPLIDGPDIYAAMRAGILAAEHTIHVEVMLFFADPYGEKIRDLLLQRARDGLEVRLLFDVQTTATSHRLARLKEIWTRLGRDFTAQQRDDMLLALEREREAERLRGNTERLREPLEHEPTVTVLDSSFPYVGVAPQLGGNEPAAYHELREQLPFFSVARIDHRKLLIFDGRRALMGGANIGQEYIHEQPFDPAVPAEQEAWVKWHDCFVELEGPIVQQL